MNKRIKLLIFTILLNITVKGQVHYIDQIRDGEDGIYGLGGSMGIAMSNDKKNIYVTSQNALSCFKYNLQTNELVFQKSYLDNNDGMNGFYGATCVELSKDDQYVYIASESEHCITIMDRDTITGLLSLNKIIYDDINGNDGLRGVHSIVISDDNRFLYTVAWNEQKISVYNRTVLNGDLTYIQSIGKYAPGGLSWPKSIKLSRDNKFVYVSSHMDNSISVFSRDSLTGVLSHVHTVENNVDGVQGLWSVKAIDISHDDEYLYAVTRNALTVFSRDVVSGQLSFLETHTDNFNGVDGLYGNYSLSISPDDKNVYTVSNLDSSLVTFSRDTGSGTLTFTDEVHVIDYWLGDGVYSTTSMLSENDHLLFTIYWESSVCSFTRDSLTGTLSYDTSIINNQNATIDGLNGANRLEISPDNKFLYVSTYYDGISTFARNDTTGMLNQYQVIKDDQNGINGIKGASSICAMPGNKFVLVTGKYDDALTVLQRDFNDSLVYFQAVYDNSGIDGLDQPSCMVVSKDAKHVYVGSEIDNGIAVFGFDTISGNINFIQFVDFFNLFGFTIAVDELHITNSGKYVFALSEGFNSLYMFRRDSTTGQLSFLHKFTDIKVNSNILYTITKMDISNDDKNLYLTYENENTILNFRIDEQSDSLNLIQVLDPNSINGFGINSVNCIKVDPEDRLVYTSSTENSVLTLYQRDLNTGILEYVRTFSEAGDVFQGLDNPSSIVMDNRNRNLYITSGEEDAISTYKKDLFLGNDLFLCDGDSANIQAGIYYNSYLWSTGDTTSRITINSSGVYSITATDEFGGTEIDTVTATFYQLPIINIGNDTSICYGNSILISAGASFDEYLWNTGEIDYYIYANTTYSYSVTVTDSNSCSNSDTMNLTVFDRPVFNITGNNEICENDSTTLGCSNIFSSYLWNDSISDSLIIARNAGIYYLEIIDTNNCAYTDSIELIVHQNPNAYLGNDTIIQMNEGIILYPQGGWYDIIVWQDSIMSSYFYVDSNSFVSDSLIVSIYAESSFGCFSSDTIIIYLDSTYNAVNDYSRMGDCIHVYPNPAVNNVIIHLEKQYDFIEISITNIQGKEMLKSKNQNKEIINLNVESLPKGLYIIKLRTKNSISSLKMIKE